jgi:hypothetical protein
VRNQNAVSVGPRSSGCEKKREIFRDREVLAGGAARAAGERVGVSLEAASPTLAEGEREDGRERRERKRVLLSPARCRTSTLSSARSIRAAAAAGSSAAPPSSVEGGVARRELVTYFRPMARARRGLYPHSTPLFFIEHGGRPTTECANMRVIV